MAKKNNNQKPKQYESGLHAAMSHVLLGQTLNQVKIHAWEDNSPFWGEIAIPFKGFGLVRIHKDYHADMYIRKSNKYNEGEWAFVFATLAIYLGLGLYKKHSERNMFIKQGLFLFAIHYVKNTLGFQDIPKDWEGFFEVEKMISFKNENSVIDQLQTFPELMAHVQTIGFLNNANVQDIEFKDQASGAYNSWGSKQTFADIFVDNLVNQAQRTIALRSSINFTDEDLKKRNTLAYKAKHWFELHFPLLSSLSASFKVIEDIQLCKTLGIEIAAVSAVDKTIYINPLAQLSELGTRFAIAHEILHIALDHSRRRKGRDPLIWNLACDFVINHWLVEMNIGIAPDRIYMDKTLAGKSADEIYLMIAGDVRLKKRMTTLKDTRAGEGNNKKSCDMLDEDPAYFAEFADACKEALLRGIFMHEASGRGDLPADLVEEIKAINQPVIPWQVELAQWLAERFPLDDNRRTYSRPSRRQSSTPDIPRASYIKPTYEKHSRTYGVIMDTSGSMDKELLGKCLGAVGSYSAAQEVKEVRLIFCDAQPYDEGFVPVELLANKIKVKGRGGTVLQQAVNYLQNCQDFPDDAPILILTDGFFESDLKVEREHAFLVPNKAYMPFSARNVFEFK